MIINSGDDVLIDNIDELLTRVKEAQHNLEVVSIAFIGNIVEVWEEFDKENIFIHLGSDQTSLHNPWSGGYYPVGLSFEESNEMISKNPKEFESFKKLSFVDLFVTNIICFGLFSKALVVLAIDPPGQMIV